MQTYLFGESKASEFNFVGDLAEKVSKAVQSNENPSSTKARLLTNRLEHIPLKEPLGLPSPDQSRYKNPRKKISTQTVVNKPNQFPR